MITKRQEAILKILLDADRSGRSHDMDTLMSALAAAGHSVGTKQSIQCSIRFLERKDLVQREYEARRERKRAVLLPTHNAYKLGIT